MITKYLREDKIINGRTSFDAMRARNLTAQQVVNDWKQEVAWSFVSIINAFDPEILVVDGSIIREPNLLDGIIESMVPFKAKADLEYQTRVVPTQFGADSVLLEHH